MKKLPFFLLFGLMLFSCGRKNPDETEAQKRTYVAERNPVQIMVLSPSAFMQQLVANGKLAALCKSQLRFSVGGRIEAVHVANGQRIKAGIAIASLNDAEYRQQLAQAGLALERARLDLHDLLIGMGFDGSDIAKVPADKLALAQTRSGYASAQNNLETARRNLAGCQLTAPFAGVVANIVQKAHENLSGEAFCTLIDDSRFEVAFRVMESELTEVQLDAPVRVTSFAGAVSVTGRVSEINPVVGADGLVAVKAVVANPGSYIEGMNVSVLIEKAVPNQYVVPKSAVVLRDNQHVLFKVVGGKAYWNYVNIVMENSASYSVIPDPDKTTASLNPGDTIIVSGNLNLAHESEISFE